MYVSLHHNYDALYGNGGESEALPLQRLRSTHDLQDLIGDGGLAGLVVGSA
jgi:hypothetical protein